MSRRSFSSSSSSSKWNTLRSRLLPFARSIEETWLDPSSDAEQYALQSSSGSQPDENALLLVGAPGTEYSGGLKALKMDAEVAEARSSGLAEAACSLSRIQARNRWKRLRNTVVFAAALKSPSSDLIQERVDVGAAASEGSKPTPQAKGKGRKGLNGLVVQQDRGYISHLQDFYVACLKLPALQFFIGVFLAPVALALLFTPVYLFDLNGLKFSDQSETPLCSTKWSCLNVLLYSLSLSTTFGGSPVSAVSPLCLMVANVHTLMAQFLFVFLSGAVFARMSQPAHPIRCSKKALIKHNDFTADQTEEDTKSKVFVVRMVLTGPPPCELVDAKIRLTFRIFVRLSSGSMFCSTQDLDLVRSEVAYLRYGLTIRHVINSKSPIYGHTIDSLAEGDASFCLTIMGVERSSMQPIFHLEDYFVCDGDVVWNGEYLDFVRVNEKGERVLEHSKIDMLKSFKAAGNVARAVTRMERSKAAESKKAE